ncbi:MAG: flavodoxin family protein [Erysipelotrichaceae bacterium]|nr:flavodoxin family protein [Erysipelotrichaceae bacterium]
MKVLLINGSPNQKGCTYTALMFVKEELEKEGIETELFQVRDVKTGCRDCGYCEKNRTCVFKDDVQKIEELMKDCDGLVLGSPVYYAGVNGTLKSLLDRLFHSKGSALFRHKAAAAVTSSRRAGNLTTFDALNKYFLISEMHVIGSCYWNDVHGNTPEEVLQDEEGVDVMRQLGRNMAYYLHLVELGRKEGIPEPERLPRRYTNFIR